MLSIFLDNNVKFRNDFHKLPDVRFDPAPCESLGIPGLQWPVLLSAFGQARDRGNKCTFTITLLMSKKDKEMIDPS